MFKLRKKTNNCEVSVSIFDDAFLYFVFETSCNDDLEPVREYLKQNDILFMTATNGTASSVIGYVTNEQLEAWTDFCKSHGWSCTRES